MSRRRTDAARIAAWEAAGHPVGTLVQNTDRKSAHTYGVTVGVPFTVESGWGLHALIRVQWDGTSWECCWTLGSLKAVES